MAQAPKCKNCGKAHWGRCPLWDAKSYDVPAKVPVNEAVPNGVPNRTESARVGEWKKRNAEKVRAYQRDWMRRKRANV